MLRLLTIILLFLPSCVFGQSIKVPDVIAATGKLVMVQPEFTPKPLATEFVVFGDKSKPEYATIGNAVLVAEPDADDEITIVIAAVFEGNKLITKVCKVQPRKPAAGTPPTTPTTPGTNPPVGDRDIPVSASNLHVILVVDPAGTPADLAGLAQGENAVTRALAVRKSFWYVRNSTDSLVGKLQPSWQGKAFPVLLVIDGNSNPRKVIAAETVVSAGSTDQTARRIITQIANAVGK